MRHAREQPDRQQHWDTKRVAIVVAATVGAVATSAHAITTYPVILGAGSSAPTAVYRYQSINGINNAGTAIGVTSRESTTGTLYGFRSFAWGPSIPLAQLQPTAGEADPATQMETTASSINDAGVIVGTLRNRTFGQSIPTRWPSPSGQPSVMKTLPNTYINNGTGNVQVLAVNHNGLAVGDDQLRESNGSGGSVYGGDVPAVWDAAGNVVQLPLPPDNSYRDANGHFDGFATLLNDNGVVAGSADQNSADGTQFLARRVLRWNAATYSVSALVPLAQTADGRSTSLPVAMNRSGDLVGLSQTESGGTLDNLRAVRWNAGTVQPTLLAALGTDINGQTSSTPTAINDAGLVGGKSDKYDAQHTYLGNRPVLWSASGAVTALDVIGPNGSGVSTGTVRDLNEMDAAVGTTSAPVSSGSIAAVLWLPNTTAAINLNTLVKPQGPATIALYDALYLSDTGFIACYGAYDPDGAGPTAAYTRAFTLLVPQAGTYGKGDANFDTKTDFSDLVILAQHYNASNVGQNPTVADFDLNGVTDFNDLVTLAQHYNSGGPSLAGAAGSSFTPAFAADWALAQSLVPEPTAILMLATIVPLATRRRTWSHRRQ